MARFNLVYLVIPLVAFVAQGECFAAKYDLHKRYGVPVHHYVLLKNYTHPYAGFSIKRPAGSKVELGSKKFNCTKENSVVLKWKGGNLVVKLCKPPLDNPFQPWGNFCPGPNEQVQAQDQRRQEIKVNNLEGEWHTGVCNTPLENAHPIEGPGECLDGFLSDGKQTVYFEKDNKFPTEVVTKSIIPSFSLKSTTPIDSKANVSKGGGK